MTTEIAAPEQLDPLIYNVAKAAEVLSDTTITDPAYVERAQSLVKAVTAAAAQHRNWNPVMESIDGMIDYEAEGEYPVGFRQPAIDRDDYTGYEECVEELFYRTTIVNLEKFKIQDVFTIGTILNGVGELSSYSTDWNPDRGVFASDFA